jgi:ABC-type amino acid transport substrate-binding protein
METVVHFALQLLHGRNLEELVYTFCRDHPILAWLAGIVVIALAGAILVPSLLEFIHKVRGASLAGIGLGIVMAFLLSACLVVFFNVFLAPVPVLTAEKTFVRKPAVVSWDYNSLGAASGPLAYQVEIAQDRRFRIGRSTLSVDATSHYSYQPDGPRFWRVRAVHRGRPLSGWSAPVETRYFPTAYSRIRDTRVLTIFVSNSINQSIFKYVDTEGRLAGADIEIGKALAKELSAHFGYTIEPRFWPVRWGEMLASPQQGGPDLIISSITRRKDRETQYELSFSDTYYCTTQSLLYRSQQTGESLLEILSNKVVGYQDKTTSQPLVDHLASRIPLVKKPFDQTDQIVQDLLLQSGTNMVGVTDSPFAVTAVLQHPDKLRSRPLKAAEYAQLAALPALAPAAAPPASANPQKLELEKEDEYAVAVHNSEGKLLDIINSALTRWKSPPQDAELVKIVLKANEDHAKTAGVNAAAQWDGLSKAECDCPAIKRFGQQGLSKCQ